MMFMNFELHLTRFYVPQFIQEGFIKFSPGALIKRLKGHESNIEMFSITDGPIFVSYGCWEEENAIKLWSIESLECIASFKLDCTASTIFMFSCLTNYLTELQCTLKFQT